MEDGTTDHDVAMLAELAEVVAERTPDDSVMSAAEYMGQERISRLRQSDMVPGARAFDFDLEVHDFSTGQRAETGRRFRLQEVAANTPVALVFGSYT